MASAAGASSEHLPERLGRRSSTPHLDSASSPEMSRDPDHVRSATRARDLAAGRLRQLTLGSRCARGCRRRRPRELRRVLDAATQERAGVRPNDSSARRSRGAARAGSDRRPSRSTRRGRAGPGAGAGPGAPARRFGRPAGRRLRWVVSAVASGRCAPSGRPPWSRPASPARSRGAALLLSQAARLRSGLQPLSRRLGAASR